MKTFWILDLSFTMAVEFEIVFLRRCGLKMHIALGERFYMSVRHETRIGDAIGTLTHKYLTRKLSNKGTIMLKCKLYKIYFISPDKSPCHYAVFLDSCTRVI
jgi:hypothetical protein